MSWTVYAKRQVLSTTGETVFALVQGLLANGVEVYGSSDTTSVDNSGSGATDYWVDVTVAATTNAWIRLRFPAFNGVVRELRIQCTATRRWSFYWSPGPTYFTSGATTTVAPTCPTATDQQYVQNGSTDFEFNYTGISTLAFMTLIVGDAAEGNSFFLGVGISGQTAFQKELFLDVLMDPNPSDIDPAIYGCGTETTEFGTSVVNHSFLTDTAVNNADSNIGGWFKKDTVDSAWVAYPLQNWGYTVGGGVTAIVMFNNNIRTSDLPQGSNSAWKAEYRRGPPQVATQYGRKGKSRLFRFVSAEVGPCKLNSARTQLSLGVITLPWDGTPYYE